MTDKEIRELRARWGSSNPVPSDAPVSDQAREEILRRILTTTRHRRWARFWPILAGVVAASVVVPVVAVVLGAPGAGKYAATPPPLRYQSIPDDIPDHERLLDLALAAEREVTTQSAPGPVEYLKLVSWDLSSRIDGRQVTSAVVPAQRELWRAPDGSARTVVRIQPPQFYSDDQRRAWHDDGSPGANTPPDVTDYPPGSYPAIWPDRPPTDPVDLTRWLLSTRPPGGVMAIVDAANDLLEERVLTGPERAALIRVLAQQPGIRYEGETVDRGGRPGYGFSVESADSGLPTRYTFIISARGRFLAYEQMLTETAGRLNVPVPSVISYTVYLTAAHVDAIPSA